ncbi:hypothetical protein O181_067142 [Austropuccinia psidii MF-1]|uniref:Reverse transcriptase Ty1/copia-type domain-containing protein n=1 Tax=Austropuccinia psidii MF-1 TaxID=1389203 RepID=A0A9Q3I4Z1_9BASI|nr:hypothetical protein [Austropuccinia psidii MF-1]
MEDSTEVISSRTKPSSLFRTNNPEPDPNHLAKGKSPRYEWIPENEPPPKEILGKVGDPRNVMESRRRPKHSANAVSLLDEECPKNFHQHWEDAIQKELDNMEKHQVWSPATLTENTKPLSTTWVFKCKTNEDGNLTKFKAPLCVRGFHQKEGIDYGDVFSPTGRLTSLQLLLTLCHLNGFTIEQMDVKCAFLNGRPDKNLYILRPNGYTKHQPSKYFILNQSLYGLKQSPRCWHKELKNALKSIGLCAAHTDPCLYYSTNQNKPMWLFIHVDDLIFGGSWNNEFKTKINNIFEMEDLGKIKFALGIRITQHRDYISLIQDKLINNILEEFNILNP